ncbi:MAG: EAL domain-containing protein [Chloroflexi bacterium]|nr:EAL domain-containing protein [Chloroflexota bacterium]
MALHNLRATDRGSLATVDPGLRAWLRRSAWLVFLVGGLALAIAAAVIGDEDALHPLVTILGLMTTAALLAGLRMHRPARPLAWRLVALCIFLTTAGVAVSFDMPTLGVLGESLTASGYIAGLVGFVILIRGRIPGGDRGAFLDAAILASGVGVLIWAFGFAPVLLASRQSSLVSAIYFYPALIASATVARMWFLGGPSRPTTRLLVLLVLSSNVITIIQMMRAIIGPDAFSGPFLLAEFASLAFVGGAALHPTMAIPADRQRATLQPLSRGRIAALAVALLVNPATLAIQASDGRAVDPAPYIVGGVLIGVLVIGRLGDALRQLGDSLRERESLMELLRRQAMYDTLTSLPNRTLFTERLASDFANRSNGQLLAVLLVDLDDFKGVNDGYGHEAGDALLVAVGRRLRAAIREGDMAARLGGDEFVVTLPACVDEQDAVSVAERILALLGEPYEIDGHSLRVHASVGVALAGPTERHPDDLVRNADVAMYLAKSRGQGRYELFEPSMQAVAMTQLQLRTDLATGIADGELRLHYQPIVDLRTGRTIGYEALVRWLHEDRLVPPMEFIPLAESSGLIGPLTDWVVDEACRVIAGWGRAGEPPWVSVNLPSSQLIRTDLVERLTRTLALSGLAADRLVIEITESSLMEIDVARVAIERLSELGVRIAIDDFGTGYSALSYLARLPIDIVKVDRSFVSALQADGPEEAIASAIIVLARQLGLTTIGEGIETAEQAGQLAALGCDLGQGFHLGRPSPDQDFRAMLVPTPSGPGWRSPAASVPEIARRRVVA